MQRIFVNGLCFTQFHDPSQIHNGNTIADMFDDAQVMRNKNIGQMIFFLKLIQQIQYLRLNRHIQCGNRFIADHQFRRQRQGSGNIDSLSLPSGKFVWITMYMLYIQTYGLEKF